MSKIADFFGRIFNLIFVKGCVACSELIEFDKEEYLCPKCAEEWEEAKSTVCETCFEMQSRCRCGFGKRYIDGVRHLALYDHTDRASVTNRIVYALKKSNYDRVFEFVAKEMAENLIEKGDLKNAIVVSIPRSPGSVKSFGYDHAKKLAIVLAEKLEVDYVDALGHRGGKTEQKKLNKAERMINAKNNCFLKDGTEKRICGKKVLLVDDIGTTGAMTGACAELLHNAGAVRIKCILAAKNKLKK